MKVFSYTTHFFFSTVPNQVCYMYARTLASLSRLLYSKFCCSATLQTLRRFRKAFQTCLVLKNERQQRDSSWGIFGIEGALRMKMMSFSSQFYPQLSRVYPKMYLRKYSCIHSCHIQLYVEQSDKGNFVCSDLFIHVIVVHVYATPLIIEGVNYDAHTII